MQKEYLENKEFYSNLLILRSQITYRCCGISFAKFGHRDWKRRAFEGTK